MNQPDTAGVVAPPPLIFLGVLLIGLAWHRLVANDPIPLDASIRFLIAGLFGLVGIALLIAALGGFRRAGTPPEPWEPTRAIVTTGIYARTRNPMYLAMALLYLALAFAFDSLATLILFVPLIAIVNIGVIAREERYLSARFGREYDAYRSSVRRWL